MTLAQIIDAAYERERRDPTADSGELLYKVIDELARRSGTGPNYTPEISGGGSARRFEILVFTPNTGVYRVRVKAPFSAPRVSVTGSHDGTGQDPKDIERLYSAILSDNSYSATHDTLTREAQP